MPRPRTSATPHSPLRMPRPQKTLSHAKDRGAGAARRVVRRRGCCSPQSLSSHLLFAAEDVVPHLEEFTTEESEEIVLESQEVIVPESREPEEVVVPDSKMEVVPESQMVPDSITSEFQELAPDSEMMLGSLPPGSFLWACCHLVHEDRQASNRAHSRFWPCSRCGLIHTEYIIRAMLHGLDEFNCELFIQHYKDLLPVKDDAKASQE
nr:uncharacterized protein LOC117835293 [Setaria viridis]